MAGDMEFPASSLGGPGQNLVLQEMDEGRRAGSGRDHTSPWALDIRAII